MELTREFFRLPLQFDVARLQEECSQFSPEDWIDHPQKHAGNTALILISVGGGMNHEFSFAGKMAPTPFLERCPYVRQVLSTLEAPVSRSRLMRLSPKSVVPRHDDVSFHWFRRVRVHVPIFTNPGVRFRCAGRAIHMGAGEAWIFDNFRNHMVENAGDQTRIHLVADTRGSPAFWDLVARAADPLNPGVEGSPARLVPYDPSLDAKVPIEEHEFDIMLPDDLDRLLGQILEEAGASLTPAAFEVTRARAETFGKAWRAAFEHHGPKREAVESYRDVFTAWVNDPALGGALKPNGPATRALRVIKNMFVVANGTVTRTVAASSATPM